MTADRSAPTQPALSRIEQAEERVRHAVLRTMPEQKPEVIRVPVFAPGDLAKLAAILDSARQCLYTLEGIVTDIDQALKTADRISARDYTPRKAPAVRVDERPTATAAGPMKILRMLLEAYPECIEATILCQLCQFSGSTLRTYIPVLRDGKLISEEKTGDARTFIITEQGIALVQAQPEL